MGRKHDHDFFPQQFASIEFIRVDRAAHKCDIESPCEKAGRGFYRVLAVQDEA